MRMRSLAVALLSLTLASPALAAGKKSSGSTKSKSKSKASASSSSGHHKEDLEAAKGMIKPFQPWDDSYKKVSEKIGPPDKVEGDKNYWYALDGEKCAELEVDKMGDSVGTMGLNEYGKEMAAQYAKCAKK